MAKASEDQSRVAYGDMKEAGESGVLEQLEKIARSLSPRPNKKLMANPDRFVEILVGVIDKIKSDPKLVFSANLFYLEWAPSKNWACDLAAHITPKVRDWFLTGPHKDLSGLELVDRHNASRAMGVYFYLLQGVMKAYVGSGTSLEGVGGIYNRIQKRANLKKSSAGPFERHIASHQDEPKQIAQLMETRIRSPDDEPYPTDEVPCLYWQTAPDLEQEDLNRLRFMTVLRENVFMMLVGSMADSSMNHCAWKPVWGGFNQIWALRGAVPDVFSPVVDGILYDTKAKARVALALIANPVGHQAKVDEINANRVARNAEKKAADPVGYRAMRDAKNAKNSAKNAEEKAADPVGYQAKVAAKSVKDMARIAEKKAADPVGYQATRDAINARNSARNAEKKAADPVGYRAMRDVKNAQKKERKAKRAAEEVSEQKKTNHSIDEYFNKKTKLETNLDSEGTQLVASKYFAKK